MCCVVTLLEQFVRSTLVEWANGGIYNKYINAYIIPHYYKLCRGILFFIKFCRDYTQCIWLILVNKELVQFINIISENRWPCSFLCLIIKFRENPKAEVTKDFGETLNLAWLMAQGMVISLEMMETEMGDRGSKSVIL